MTPDDQAGTADESAILILAPTGRDAAASREMLQRARLHSVICDGAGDLVRRITAGSGAAVVTAEAVDHATADALRGVLDAQPTWSDLPLLIFSRAGGLPPRLRHLAGRRNTTLLHRPIQVSTFVTASRAALENRRRQYEVRDLLRRLERRAAQLQRLTVDLTEAEERERQRLAEILHDDLQQILVGASYHLGLLPERARDEGVEPAVQSLSALLKQAIETSRHLSHQLSPPTLRQLGLVHTLRWLAGQMHERHGLQVVIETDATAEPAEASLKVFLFRCAQEFLFNVVKHANCDRAHLRLTRQGDHIALQIQDHGRGFAPAGEAPSPSQHSLGLLSIRERAGLLGGRLDVHSRPGGGSTLTVVLPCRSLAPADGAAPSVNQAATPCRSRDGSASALPLKVALVDDHQVIRSGLKALLEEQDRIEVIGEADDGAEAVQLAGQLQPDVILMDVAMPGMDGIEATQRIKARHPEIRIIGLSMFDDDQTARQMEAAGAEGYLTKSGSEETLISAVRGQAPAPTGSDRDAAPS